MVTIGDIMLGDDLGPVNTSKRLNGAVSVPKKNVRKAHQRYPVSLGLIGITSALMLVIILL